MPATSRTHEYRYGRKKSGAASPTLSREDLESMRKGVPKTMYIYGSHLGGLYATDEERSKESLYCEMCGDWDWFYGQAETREEAWDLLKDCLRDHDYIQKFLDKTWRH